MNYKRKKPRRQVRCTLCTDNRDGNAGQGKPETEEPATRFGPATRKRKKAKPWELWVKREGPRRPLWAWERGWWRVGRYATRSGVEQAAAKWARDAHWGISYATEIRGPDA